jgi:hypothetical protein
MEWETIEYNLFRTKVPNGWLVKISEHVMTNMHPNSIASEGYEWRSSICFVPDEGHYWKIEPKSK